MKEIINDLVSEAAKLISASRFCLCKIRNKTVENVLSSIDMETVAVAETKTPTQRYKFDSAWALSVLEKDEELSKIEDSEFYYFEFCR